MNETKIIKEIYWLRALACLAVVVGHAINMTLENYSYSLSPREEHFLIGLRFISFFGTPAFIFISEILLAHSYPDNLPKGFLWKRVKFLIIPFVFMGGVFAFITSESLVEAVERAAMNIFLGGYTGYFVLIIFQFYLLHLLLHKYLEKASPLWIISGAFVVNTLYLGFFHLTEAPDIILGEYIWNRGYWLPFLGWIFYFVIGYYGGRNYRFFIQKLLPWKHFILVGGMVNLLVIFVLTSSDILTVVSSKRVDYLTFTLMIVMTVLLYTQAVKKVPYMIQLMSKYSFNIYLLHNAFLYMFPPIEGMAPFVYFLLSIFVSIGLSILVVKFAAPFRWSPYFIGKTIPIKQH
ncbi:acyltransferase family protein [Alkalicoccus saliphilus]|uniref:Adhesin n=1 Tax=Alkalicoccus saliphilus TaxID=200989 RepID=A0A2T4U3K9_9BACI|nr:acyltransferase family protein [Alkalicoccus saliphilus]PTL37959.1 adhesin [Alkalicoccus saliphilus]